MFNIMIVDDEPTVLKTISMMLNTTGHNIIPVLGGVKAKELLENPKNDYDLLITDLNMNPINGMQLLNIVLEETIVIVLTAYGKPETAMEAIQLGAFDYIAKPCRLEKLLATVSSAIQSKTFGDTPRGKPRGFCLVY